MSKIIINIDTSELDTYQLCDFKWKAEHQLHLRPKEPVKAMEGGSLVHVALEHYYKFKRDTYKSQAEIIEEVIELTRIAALEFETLEPGEVTDTIFQYREYCRFYANENWIPLYVEQPFIFKFYEDEFLVIYLTGKPDLVFKYAGTKTIGVCDHKKSARAYRYSSLRNQFPLYATAMNTDTVIVNKIGFQTSLKVQERMVRQTFVYHKELLEEWRRDTILWIKKLIIANETDFFPRNRTSCEKWNGCFLERYCSTRPEAREFLIGSEYKTSEAWDVTKSLNKPITIER